MIWISLKQAAGFYGISERSIRTRIASGKLVARSVTVRGGTTSEISLTGEDEVRYLAGSENADAIAETVNDSLSVLTSLKGWQQEYVSEWVTILTATKNMNGVQLEFFMKTYKPASDKIKLSRGTIYRKRADYEDMGIAGLAPAWGKANESKVKTEWLNEFASLWAQQSRPSAEACRRIVFGKALKADPAMTIDQFPHANTFVRKVKEKLGKSATVFARYGEAVWNRECGTYIPRDWTMVPSGSWWVSDHHQLDVLVVDKFGRTGRPWVTVWMDMRSMKFLSAYLHMDAPHSDHVFQSFAWAVEEHTLPDGIYLDNGKDYLVHDFTGGVGRHSIWMEENDIRRARSVMAMCECQVIFAKEYNAQAKHLEPRFKRVCKDFATFLPGYTSNNMVNRPTEKLTEELKVGKVLPYETVESLFKEWVFESYNHTPSDGQILKGLSPNQGWDQHRSSTRKVLSDDSMKLLYMRGLESKVFRGYIKDETLKGVELYYTAPEFINLEGVKVYMRRDIRAWNKAYVFDAETDQFICTAEMATRVAGIAADISREDLREGIQRKKHALKQVRTIVKETVGEEGMHPREIMEYQKFAVKALEAANASAEAPQPPVKVTTIHTEIDKAVKTIEKKNGDTKAKDEAIDNLVPWPDTKDDLDLWGSESIAL